jgi:hypothetical protein
LSRTLTDNIFGNDVGGLESLPGPR